MSLATRLSAFFLVSLALVLSGFSTALYLLARMHLQRDLDENLVVALDALSTAAEIEPDRIEWRPSLRPDDLQASHTGEDPVRWVVYDQDGKVIDRSGNAGEVDFSGALGPVPELGHVHLGHVDRGGRRWRLAVRRLRPARPVVLERASGPHTEPGGPLRADENTEKKAAVSIHSTLTLAAGAPLAPVEARLRSVGWVLFGLSTGLWALAALAGRYFGRRALRPVWRMATVAGAMSPDDRDGRLPSPGTGDELEALAQSFNALLGRLHEAYERQRRFAGDASHQLRTPLAALLGQVEVARRRDRSGDEYRRVLDQVHAEAQRLHRIVEALLFLARAGHDAECPGLERVDLADWLPGHLQRWSGQSRGPDLRWELHEPGPVDVLAHRTLLGQLVDNLVENACKYSEPGSPIVVRLTREPGRAVLTVEDRGEGLLSDDLPHLFEPFYRSAGARRRGKPGVGLGLAVVQRVAQAFGGAVVAESEPGRGSRFVVRLPEAPTRAASGAAETVGTAAASP